MNRIRQYIAIAGATLLPFVAAAQTFGEVYNRIKGFLNQIIPFLVLIATIIFLFGVVRYITAGGDEERIKEARNLIFWGVVLLAVMIAVWGFVNIVLTFIFGTSTPFGIPPQGGTPQQP